ncbi:ACT domain-containing protein [Candidatus Woesearchaeota archaeon]|nr:ACT domain-containing protein [Candidatus Woesearchaeota archaeon]MBW3006269.1 ACT domain-containing protein [Candidatus Woesearchaeota archaeon]
MKKSTTELTVDYIKEHPCIKSCLKKGLINYSSLARLVAKDLNIEKKTSKEAILIAARRFHDKLKKEAGHEKKIESLLSKSELEIKNKIVVFILEKNINFDIVEQVQKQVKHENGTFYLLEGSRSYTLITQERYAGIIDKKFKLKIAKKNTGLAMVDLKSPKDIETTVGVLSYLTALFAENGVNIVEFFSCWIDTLFIIPSNDVSKVINFLKF